MTKFHCIINPVSGGHRGKKIIQDLIPIFKESGIEIYPVVTKYRGHASELGRDLHFDDYSGICILGGDGTIHEFINGMLTRADGKQLPIGVIPAGTGNSLSHDLSIESPLEATQAIIKGKTIKCDIAEIRMGANIQYSFNVIGWGIPVDVNLVAEKLRWFRGQRYNVAALVEILMNRKRKAKITFNNTVIEDHFKIIVACNTQFTGNGMKMAPNANLNDGLLDLLIIKSVSRQKLFRLFTRIFNGTHVPDSDILYYQVESFKLESFPDTILNIDGETKGETPVEVKMNPGMISVFK